ncbi:DICT sensory domain-containing protein [Nocardioides sp.]|uniref:DICT sensory domain-containing protein n=1 Tax=Nocardioides sp. TaxID=35761 RepID=UPI003510F254
MTATLTIGELADRTGVAAATLRVWETRYGFPVPQRRASGHRRYDERLVDVVLEVVRRRDEGVRLDVAISQALNRPEAPVPVRSLPRRVEPMPGSTSIYSWLRRTHPHLQAQALSKRTLLALSWAIEDEFCSRAHRAHMFGAFQTERNYRASERRWRDLARTTSSTFCFADFAPDTDDGSLPHLVSLAADHPMSREWAVVCDSPDLPAALVAWELPGQVDVPEWQRRFEAVWTVDATAVREAARVCATAAHESGVEGARGVVSELAVRVDDQAGDPLQVTALFNRVVTYLDRQR